MRDIDNDLLLPFESELLGEENAVHCSQCRQKRSMVMRATPTTTLARSLG